MTSLKKRCLRSYSAVKDSLQGRVVNEDAYLIDSKRMLFGVADGFGGDGIGDVAAKKCLEDVKFFVENGLGDSQVTLPFVYRSYYTASANLLFNAFLFSNQNLFNVNKESHINGRAGSSVLFAYLDQIEENTSGKIIANLTIANVGSCAAFLLRDGEVTEILKPRSFLSFKTGRTLSAVETENSSEHSQWMFPLMSFGMTADLEPEVTEIRVQTGDQIILSTDGLYPFLNPEDIAQNCNMADLAVPAGRLSEKISKENQILIDVARKTGSKDDITLLSIVI